jgi:5-methylcytosine-specific restriction endonuclease McrA
MKPRKTTKLLPRLTTIDTRNGSSIATKRITGYALVKIRERIGLRDLYTCRKCGRVTTKGQVDHVIPLFMGGAESDENRQWL